MRGKALKNYGTVAALVIIIGIFGLLRPASFFTLKNFLNITRQAAPLAMVALGATFVMTVNEFDLSIGNHRESRRRGCGTFIDPGCSDPGLLPGGGCGRTCRWMCKRRDRCEVWDPFLYYDTGHGNRAGRRDLRTYRRNDPVFNGIPKAFTIPGILKIAGIPFITIVAAVLYMVFHIFMNHMSAGRKLYAIGGSEEAARVAGIRIFRYRVLAFALSAAMAGLAGALVASRVGSANTTAGQGYFLQSYAAVFIGCTVSKSGVPCVIGTLVGTIILAVLANGLTILQMPSFMQNIITGGIIILAVVVQKLGAGYGSR